MKKLFLPLLFLLFLINVSFTSESIEKQVSEDDPMDCAVLAFNQATSWCNSREGGCTSEQFNFFAGTAYDVCLGVQPFSL